MRIRGVRAGGLCALGRRGFNRSAPNHRSRGRECDLTTAPLPRCGRGEKGASASCSGFGVESLVKGRVGGFVSIGSFCRLCGGFFRSAGSGSRFFGGTRGGFGSLLLGVDPLALARLQMLL